MGRIYKMKKSMSMLVGTAMLAVLLVGCQSGSETASTTEVPAEEMLVEEETVSTVEAWGEVSAQNIKEVHIDFDATVSEIYVTEGQEVKQGDKLLSLDYEEYKNSILQKEKELSLDQTTLEGQIKSSSGSSQKISNLRSKANSIQSRINNGTDTEIVALQAEITSYKSDLNMVEKDIEIQKELVAAGSATQKEVDDLEKKASDLKNKIGSAEQKVSNLKKDRQVEISDLNSEIASIQDSLSETEKSNQVAINSSSIKQEISDLEVQQMKSKYTKDYIQGNDIVLDIPQGVIKAIKVVQGSQVGGTNTCLLEILDEESLVIKANVSEEFIKGVKVGADADIIPYADREAVIKGKVKEIQNMAIDNNGETVIPVIIEAAEDSPYLRYGYSVDVEIYTEG
ncbi:MAG: biotin/lipoyl-binding protein [Cellulosilyticum sp.]|nr:biotin/lipoyl-binding protein [Cellulosilyticum sp.]